MKNVFITEKEIAVDSENRTIKRKKNTLVSEEILDSVEKRRPTKKCQSGTYTKFKSSYTHKNSNNCIIVN